MAEFDGIFCHPFLPSILIIERWVGWVARWDRVGRGGVGGEGGGKNYRLGHPMSSHDAQTVANDTIVGSIVSESKFSSPLPNWHPPWVPLFQP